MTAKEPFALACGGLAVVWVALELAGVQLPGVPAGTPLPQGAVARVGEQTIERASLDALQDAADAMVARSAGARAATPPARGVLLDRLIDEELLIARGLELDLARRDSRVRAALVDAMTGIALADADAAAEEPDSAALAAHLARHPDRFRLPARIRVRALRFRAGAGGSSAPARVRADRALARLAAGDPWPAVAEALSDPQPFPPPDAAMALDRLAAWLGLADPRVLDGLGVGSRIVTGGTDHDALLVEVLAFEPARAPGLAEARSAVRADWLRTRDEAALARYLDWLRARTRVVRTEPDAG